MATANKGQFVKGFTPWNKGKMGVQKSTRKGLKLKPLSDDTKRKIGLAVSKEKHPLWKGGLPKCFDCGKGLSNYNNRKCAEHNVMMGEKNPMWNGGISTVKHIMRGTSEWRKWRELVFKRDSYRCIDCGTGGYLEPHHIVPLKSTLERAYDINNGITLCRPCHRLTLGKELELSQTYFALVQAQL